MRLDFRDSGGDDARMISRPIAALVLLATSGVAQTPASQGPPNPTGRIAQHPTVATTVVGLVTNLDRVPLGDAEVRLMAGDSQVALTRTDAEGHFAASGILGSRPRLSIRQVGYAARDVELFFPRDSVRVLIVELDRVVAEDPEAANDSSHWLREFNERRRTNGVGHYLTRREIMERRPRYLTDALRSIPGLLLSPSRSGGNILRMRGCRHAPIIWIDGGRAPATELDEVARIHDVAAVEVYTTLTGVPAQYADRSNFGCGTIIVWTMQ